MKAQDNIKYANIVSGVVSWIFTKNDMSEWNENDLLVVEIPKNLVSKVSVGTEYNNGFVFHETIPTEDNVVYAMLDSNNALLYTFTKEQKQSYTADEKVVTIPNIQINEIKVGDVYNNDTKSFNVDLEYVRNLYINLTNDSYSALINIIMGEDTPLTEMISWETQEKEAKAYLQTNDIAQASSISVMATTQGRDINEFANKIIEKAHKYRVASSFLIGYRQKVIKELENANNIESIRASKFDKDYVLQQLQSMSQKENT